MLSLRVSPFTLILTTPVGWGGGWREEQEDFTYVNREALGEDAG